MRLPFLSPRGEAVMRPLVGLALLVLCCSACTNIYREQKRSQQRIAKSLRPARLEQSQSAPSQALRALKLHVYADSDYRAQNQAWRGNLNQLVSHANRMLSGELTAELKVESTDEWSRVCPLSDLQACLVELTTLDPGGPDVWVLGLVGSMPQLTRTFDQLGRASVPGRHMILRGMSDLDERDGIEQLDRISPTDRRRLVRQRREHKGTVVLLHELAHTLGAHHEREGTFILNPSYDHEQSAFTPATIALMKGMLDVQLAGLPVSEQNERYRALIERYGTSWDPAERAQTLASLLPTNDVARPSQSTNSYAVIAHDDDPALSPLSDTDRVQYAQAVTHANELHLTEGLPIALDLATRYPQVYPVQHLACGMAMQQGGDLQWIESVCQPALDLARQQKP